MNRKKSCTHYAWGVVLLLAVGYLLQPAEANSGASADERVVQDMHIEVSAGGTVAIPFNEIERQFQGAEGEPQVSRLLLRPGRHGSVQIKPEKFLFTPEDGFNGTGVLHYEVKDSEGALEGKIYIKVIKSDER